jgi:hypothetical protein
MNKEQKIQELTERIENSQAELDELKQELQKLQKKPYEINYPNDGQTVYYPNHFNGQIKKSIFKVDNDDDKSLYEKGLMFDTKEQAEQFIKEQTLIKKIKCWTKEQQGDWKPDWSNFHKKKWWFRFSSNAKVFTVIDNGYYMSFTKFPIFKTEEIAQACIDEFGEEIIEVFC